MRFQVTTAHSLKEAFDAIRQDGAVYPVSGGTDILPRVNQKIEEHPSYLLLSQIPELRYIEPDGDGYTIGAMTTLTEIAEAQMAEGARVLQQAASQVASPQIRNSGTIGGNLLQENRCIYFNQSVSWRREECCFKLGGDRCYQYRGSKECVALLQSDTAPALMSLGATVVLEGESGMREIPVGELYLPRGRNNKTLRPGELLTKVRIPSLRDVRSAYVRETIRGSIDFPLISCAAALHMDGERVCRASVVIGCAGSRPAHAEKSEELLCGKRLAEVKDCLEAAAEQAKSAIMPFRDSRVDGPTRKVMGVEAVRKALEMLIEKNDL